MSSGVAGKAYHGGRNLSWQPRVWVLTEEMMLGVLSFESCGLGSEFVFNFRFF